jgi:predicted DNA binding CopG/RHH family protein
MKKPDSEKCNSTLSLRMTDKDLAKIKKTAKEKGWSIKMLVREAVMQFIGAAK